MGDRAHIRLVRRLPPPHPRLRASSRNVGSDGPSGDDTVDGPPNHLIRQTASDTLKESGDLEYGADVVAILTEPDDRQATGSATPVDLTVSKNRNGETGQVKLIFVPERGEMRPGAKVDRSQ